MKKVIGLALVVSLVFSIFPLQVLADQQQVDNDLVLPGNQNIVNLTAAPGAPVNTAGQIVIQWSGGNHLIGGTGVLFVVDHQQTTLPAGYQVGPAPLFIPPDWSPGKTASGWSPVFFNAPLTPGFYSFTVKWRSLGEFGNQLTGAPALVINLSVANTDTTPPLVNVSFPVLSDPAGWFVTSPVVGAVNASDPSKVTALNVTGATLGSVSGIGTPVAGGALSVSAEGITLVTATATDGFGNSGAAPGSNNTVTIRIDTIAPAVTASAVPAPNPAGWNNSDVTVTFSATDSGSGIAGIDPPVVVSSEGAGQVIYGSAQDVAGNIGKASVTLNIDKTAPVISGSRTPVANGFGWNNGDVTVSFSATDNLSGVASVSGPTTLTSEGAGQSVTGSAADRADNSSSTTVSGINIDKTAPVITITGPAIVLQGSVVSAVVAASDSLSGLLDNPSGNVALDTTGAGTRTITRTVVDRAGNSATASFTYTVWGIIGPFAPLVKNGNGTNQFKAGSSIPVKFQITDGQNLITTATGNATIGTFSAPFRWDATAQQYVSNVNTDKTPAAGVKVGLSVNGVGSVTLMTIDLR